MARSSSYPEHFWTFDLAHTAQWLLPNKALREQGVEENELVVLKKKFFVSDPEIDRNDPVQVNLLYHQVYVRGML